MKVAGIVFFSESHSRAQILPMKAPHPQASFTGFHVLVQKFIHAETFSPKLDILWLLSPPSHPQDQLLSLSPRKIRQACG